MAVDSKRSEMLQTYGVVVTFLPQTYTADKVIAEAYSDFASFRQSTVLTKKAYSRMLWDKALRCGTVFPDRPVNSLFNDGLLPGTRKRVCQLLTFRLR